MIDILAGADAARDLAARLRAAPHQTPFGATAKAALAELSQRILTDADLMRRAEAVALGFWLRPANIAALEREFAAPAHSHALRVPAGVVLHIPPANVETMFVYSWALALLCGNRSAVRLSARRGAMADGLLRLLAAVLDTQPVLRAGNAFVEYGHSDAITGALSAACDLRVIWGGNATVAAVRAVPLSPHAKEVVFADRLSLAALSAEAVQRAGEQEIAALARRLFNDVYSFDQMGCSSPRLLVWVGTDQSADAAQARLSAAMEAELTRRAYHVEPATAMVKLTFVYGAALEGRVRCLRPLSTDWMVADLGDGLPHPLPHEHCGGGLLFACRVARLEDIAGGIDRSVQTLSHFGFDAREIEALAQACAGRGIDRLVPVGEALAFGPLWDGYDLFAEMTRLVSVRSV